MFWLQSPSSVSPNSGTEPAASTPFQPTALSKRQGVLFFWISGFAFLIHAYQSDSQDSLMQIVFPEGELTKYQQPAHMPGVNPAQETGASLSAASFMTWQEKSQRLSPRAVPWVTRIIPANSKCSGKLYQKCAEKYLALQQLGISLFVTLRHLIRARYPFLSQNRKLKCEHFTSPRPFVLKAFNHK